MALVRHRRRESDRLGVHFGPDGLVVVGLVLTPTSGEVAVVERRPLGAGSVRNGLLADRAAAVAALSDLALPDVPAVVACDARTTEVGSEAAVVVSGWSGTGVRTQAVPVDAIVRLREVVALAGLRSIGWVAADLAVGRGVVDRLVDPNARLAEGDSVAAAAGLWPAPESWPVGMPAPPASGWHVDHVG